MPRGTRMIGRGVVVAAAVAVGVAAPAVAVPTAPTPPPAPVVVITETPTTPAAAPTTSPASAPVVHAPACDMWTGGDGRTWHWCLPPRDDTADGASVNGWPPDPDLRRWEVPGTTASFQAVDGPPGALLAWVALAWDRRVEGLSNGVADEWGYHDRSVRGEPSLLSDHASGTAVDVNATCHPLGVAPGRSLTEAQIAEVRAIVDETGGVVEWGGDWAGRPDTMHFGLAPDTTIEQVEAALDALGGPAPTWLVTMPSRAPC